MYANDIVYDAIGAWGLWQKRTVFFIFLCKITACWCMAVILFTAPHPKQVPVKCKNRTDSNSIGHISDNAVQTNNVDGIIEDDSEYYTVLHPEQIEPNDKQFEIGICDVEADYRDHVRTAMAKNHRKKYYGNNSTVVVGCDSLSHKGNYLDKETRFDLICSRNLVAATTQFFHLSGVLLGGVIGMNLLKLISPKNLMLVGMLSQISTGFGLAFVNHFELQLLLRFLCSVSCAQMYTAGQMIMTDIVGKNYHRIILPLYETFWSIGVICLPLLATLTPTWKTLYIGITTPTIFYCIIWFFIADSPIWHLNRGNNKRAMEIVLDAAIINRKSYVLRVNLLEEVKIDSCKKQAENASYTDLWRKDFSNTFFIHIVWGVIITSHNGLLLNTRAFGRENLHRNIMLTGISELIGVTFAFSFILRNQRKWLWTGLLNIIAGFFVVVLFLTIDEQILNKYIILVLVANLTVKFLVALSLTLLLSSTAELVAPQKRRLLQLSCTIWGRACLLTASYIGSLTLISTLLPLVVFSVMVMTSGFALCIINPNKHVNNNEKRLNQKEIELQEIEKLTTS